MREGSPKNLSTADSKWGSRSAPSDAKSLFRKILAASASGSRFYPDPTLPAARKPLRMNILANPEEKNGGGGGGDIKKRSFRKPGKDGDVSQKSTRGIEAK